MKTKTVVFTDMDGTFLDEKYNFQNTKSVVEQLSAFGASVIFCSSKTRSEIEYYRKATGINEPFISENGSAIFIPKGYFSFNYACSKSAHHNIIKLGGTTYDILRDKLQLIKKKSCSKIIGFGDMTCQQLAEDSGLTLEMAKLAKERENDEPFKILQGDEMEILSTIKSEGLTCTKGGKYFHLTGRTDKGKAVAVLKDLYCQMFGRVETYGIGDGPNDFPMLKIVDKPFFIGRIKNSISTLNAWKGLLQLARANFAV